MTERIVIVGSGGFAGEVMLWLRAAWPERSQAVAGFLGLPSAVETPARFDLPLLGDPEHFEPQPSDRFLLAIGIPEKRRGVAERMLARGAAFETLVHPTAIVAPTAEIGTGSIICPYVVVSDAVRLGRFVLLNYHSSLGHDASAGDFAVLSPYASLGGTARLGEDGFLGMHATVGPRVGIGARSTVSTQSCALHDAPDDTLVFGVPGKTASKLKTGIDS